MEEHLMISPGFVGVLALFIGFLAAFAAATLLGGRRLESATRAGARVAHIDGVRGYLALSVLAHHFLITWNYARTNVWRAPESVLFSNLGPAPVIMFFMITAFLFYGKIVRGEGVVSWRSIYVSRICRLVPMYLAFVAILTFLSFWHANFALAVGPRDFAVGLLKWLSFTLVPGPPLNGYVASNAIGSIAWTLRYEWAFYLMLPLLAWAVRRFGARRKHRIIGVLAGIVLLSCAPAWISMFGFALRMLLPFAFGMLVYELYENEFIKHQSTQIYSAILIALITGAMLTNVQKNDDVLMTSMIFVLFLLVAAGNSVFGLLAQPASRLLGDASYSIYLLHNCFLHVVFQGVLYSRLALDGSWIWALLPVSAFVVAALAIFGYRYIEYPFIKLGERLSKGAPLLRLAVDA